MGKPDFRRRADLELTPELMDGPCSYEELRACLRDLARVNRMTWAYRPTLDWLERMVAASKEAPGETRSQKRAPAAGSVQGLWHAGASTDRTMRIVDVGCGYGDMLRKIEAWAARRGLAVELLGVDLNPDAVRAAREATAADSGIRYVAGDVYSCAEAEGADVVISSLVTHHLNEPEIVRLLRWMSETAGRGWFISDLHRQAMPYYVFGAVTALGRWHRFIRHDGMVSILRSFVPEDWRRICAAAGLDGETVQVMEYRPARLCVGRVKGIGS